VDRLSAWAAGSSCTDCRRGLLGWTAWRPAGHARDGNSGTRYPSGTRSDRYGYEDDFLFVCDTRIRLEPRWIRDEYFFLLAGNPTGTRYFTTAIILGCEQVKMCLFCYINYDLF
jgi:hypothetical protein